MSPIVRRSSALYVSHLGTFVLLVVGSLLAWDGPAFEIVLPYVPLWLSSSVLFSEREESYAFLRTLPVTDGDIARTKFGLLLGMSTIYLALMLVVAWARWGEGGAGPATIVHMTLMWALGLCVAACWQIGLWRWGQQVMTGVILGFMGLSLVLAIAHGIRVRRNAMFPIAATGGAVGDSWLVVPVIVVAALVGWYLLMRAGARVKTASEA